MTIVVKSDNETNKTKNKITHSKKHNTKSKYAASGSTTKNLVNIQPKPSPQFILPQPPFIYPSSNSAAVVAQQQQLLSLQLLMSSPYFTQALAALNNNNQNSNTNANNNAASTSTTSATPEATATTNTNSNDTTVNTSGNANPNTKTNGTGSTSISNPVPMPISSASTTNSKLASSAPTSLPFLPPNLSLPYIAAALSTLTNQQIINNNKNNNNINKNINDNKMNTTSNLSTSVPSNSKLNNLKNVKVQPKDTKIKSSLPTVNPSLFPKTDNNAAAAAAANAALLFKNSLFSSQFFHFLQQQQQQQQQNKPLIGNPFALPTTSSSTIPIASSTTNTGNLSSSFPSSSKVKSKVSSSSLLINKSKNAKLSSSPNLKSKIKLPIKKDPLTISKNHRRTSISQSYDPKNPMVNSLFSMMSNNNNNKINSFTNTTTSSIIKNENENGAKDNTNDDQKINGITRSDNGESNSPKSSTMATSPSLPISIYFSNLNIRSNTGSSPTMESNVLSAPNLSTLCTVASQEAKIFIPSKSSEKKSLFTTLPSTIKEEDSTKMDTKDTNIFSKMDTTNRNAPTSLLTKNIQNSKKLKDEKKLMEGPVSDSTINNVSMDEKSNNLSLPMSLPTITINSANNDNTKPTLQHSLNPSTFSTTTTTTTTTPLNLVSSSSPQSPSAISTTSSSSSSPNLYLSNGHTVPHTALQRRKSRSMSCSKDYVCELCKPNKRFVQLAHLRIHQRKHTGERPFVCSFCNKSFAQQGNLKTHQRKHTGERPFSCPICFKTFTQSGNLKAHELLHQGVRPFVCEWCDKTFTQSGNLKTHQIKMHPELYQNGDESLMVKSPASSNRNHTNDHEDKMMIDSMNEDNNTNTIPETEEDNQMMIDDDNCGVPAINQGNTKPKVENTTNTYGHDENVFGMDDEDYDEIQPMESGVIRQNSSAPIGNDQYYDEDGEEQYEGFDDDDGKNYDEEDDEEKYGKFNNTVLEFEGNDNSSFTNQPENNLKERQLLMRLKALLKRN